MPEWHNRKSLHMD